MDRDTWLRWDLPVLTAVIDGMQADRHTRTVSPAEIVRRTGFTNDEVADALDRLGNSSPAYVDGPRLASGAFQYINQVTAAAREKVGQWPTPETLADQIVAALLQAAEDETDTVQEGKLRRVAEAVSDAGKMVIVGALTNYLTGQIS